MLVAVLAAGRATGCRYPACRLAGRAADWEVTADQWLRRCQVERLSDSADLLRDNPATDDFGDHANQKRTTVRCVNTKAAPA